MEYGVYGSQRLLFVGLERSSVVFVYELPLFVRGDDAADTSVFDFVDGDGDKHGRRHEQTKGARPDHHWRDFGPPQLLQVLPSGLAPEGLLAIPQRHLFVTASEEDAREDTVRSSITIYELQPGDPTYPTILSANRRNGQPIPWGALSGLAADPHNPHKAYGVYDSFYTQSRIFSIDVQHTPAVITGEIVLRDSAGNTLDLDLKVLPRASRTSRATGAGDSAPASGSCRRGVAMHRTLKASIVRSRWPRMAKSCEQIHLAASVTLYRQDNGFQRVVTVGRRKHELVYLTLQRHWQNDAGQARIGRYEVAAGEWTFFTTLSINPRHRTRVGWTFRDFAVDSNTLAVVERDNQAGPEVTIKKIYTF